MKNNLTPLKPTTQTDETSNLELNQKPKLNAIPVGKHDDEKAPSPVERPQSPTPEQQHQRHDEDQERVEKQENEAKQSLKGKPIIFVGGGPGTNKNAN